MGSANRCAPLLILAIVSGLPGLADAGGDPAALLIKLRAEGPHAVEACAQQRFEGGLTLEDATADRSGSLDRIAQQIGLRSVHAVFRRPDGRDFAEQRARMSKRLLDGATRHRARTGRTPRLPPPDLSHIYRVTFESGADLDEALALYRADPHVVWAQVDELVEPDAFPEAPPDDRYFATSGAWGQPERDLWGLVQIRALPAWQQSLGEGIVVAVVDSGLDYLHPDIAANVWVNPGEDLDGDGAVNEADLNGIDDDGNGFVDDLRGFDFANSVDANEDGDFDDAELGDVSDADPLDRLGHGSHLSGTIAAIGNNGIGMIGVAPSSTIMPVQVFREEGGTTNSTLWRAVLYAAENGADVINKSSSCGARCPSNPIGEETTRAVHALGAILVTSAGNREDDVVHFSPEGMRELITIGSSDVQGDRSSFSNFGWQVDVLAPGGGPASNILSLRAAASTSTDGIPVAPGYERRRGSSMSTAHVAGVVALLLAARPDLDFEAVRSILRGSAFDDDAPGHDRDTAAGKADAEAALAFEPARVRGWIDAPAAGAILNTRIGSVEVRGTATGADLAHWTLSAGRGAAPLTWQPITKDSTASIVDGVLGEWPITALGNGTRVLRLSLTTSDGDRLEEFAPLSVESNTPLAISAETKDTRQPAISDGRVVWRQRSRNEDGEREYRIQGVELAGGQALQLTEPPENPEHPSISGRLVAWQDTAIRDSLQSNAAEIAACWISQQSGACDRVAVATGAIARSAPSVSGRIIVWTESDGARWLLYGCWFDEASNSCPAQLLAPHGSASQSKASLAGARVVWLDSREGGSHPYGCDLGPQPGACTPHRIDTGRFIHINPVVGGELMAFEEFLGGAAALHVCRFDEASLAGDTWQCPSILVVLGETGYRPTISGNRVVWSTGSPTENDVWYCHFDPVMRECPAQRLTGAAARQLNPAIDGDLVVFEDERNGVGVVRSLGLPSVEAPGRVVAQAGGAIAIEATAVDPMEDSGEQSAVSKDGGVEIGAAARDGASLAELGAELVRTGPGSAELRWTPAASHLGTHRVTFTAHTSGGLEAGITTRVEVPAPGGFALHVAVLACLGWLIRLSKSASRAEPRANEDVSMPDPSRRRNEAGSPATS